MSRALIPVVFWWDDGTELCATWNDRPADGHGASYNHLNPPDGVSSRNRWWLSFRRERWFHEARVRG